MIIKIRKNESKIYTYVCVILCLFASDTIYVKMYPQADNILKMVAVIPAILPMIFWHKLLNNIHTVLIIYFFGLMVVISLINGMPIESVVGIFIRFFSLYCMVLWNDSLGIDLLNVFYNVLFVILTACVICYFLFDVGLLGIMPVRLIINDSLYYSYRGYYFHWGDQQIRSVLSGIYIPSSNGVWTEPGAYQLFSNFALFYALYIKENTKKIELIILNTSVISSVSGMGLIVLVFLWGLKIISKTKHKYVAVIPIIMGVAFGVNQLLIEKSKTTNWISRVENVESMLKKVSVSWLTGAGMGKDIWSGFINYFINFGILGSVPIICMLRGVKNNFLGNKDQCTYMAFILWWVLGMLDEPLGYTNLILVLYATSIVSQKKFILKRSYQNLEQVLNQ